MQAWLTLPRIVPTEPPKYERVGVCSWYSRELWRIGFVGLFCLGIRCYGKVLA